VHSEVLFVKAWQEIIFMSQQPSGMINLKLLVGAQENHWINWSPGGSYRKMGYR